jgi:spermidine synthase
VVVLGTTLIAAGIALGVLLAATGRRRVGPGTLGVLAVALALGAAGLFVGGRCEVESAYFCASVEADAGRPGGRTLILDTLRHSYVDLADPTYLEFEYARLIGDTVDAIRPARKPLTALHIGGGGFSLPRYIAATRPGSRSMVLELDPALPELARRRLGLRTGPALRVRTGDARVALGRTPRSAADLVIGDAFGGVAVPWHLTTLEVVREIRAGLRPRGIYALNVIDYPPAEFARAEAQTLGRAFRHLALLAPPEVVAGASGGNFVLLASQAPLPLAELRTRIDTRGSGEVIASGRRLDRFTGAAPVLTDEYAPVDQLLTPGVSGG